MKDKKIGFIGQGFIGRNMADDFASRGYQVVRYALEDEYVGNREAIADCDFVFIAVPTPTKVTGFDSSAIESVLPLVGKGKVAVIKSTIIPGTTKRLQDLFPDIIIMHSPEFLRERFAVEDTRSPERNIVGVLGDSEEIRAIAKEVISVLPKAKMDLVCKAEEAELIKYGGNCFLTMKVVYMNLLYELSQAVGADYDVVARAVGSDERIGMSHTKVIDASSADKTPGRGAGGHCFPKDLAAFRESYEKQVTRGDDTGTALLRAIEAKNNELLRSTNKDLELLKEIYGE